VLQTNINLVTLEGKRRAGGWTEKTELVAS